MSRAIFTSFLLLLCNIAHAQNLVRDTIPAKWLDPLLPEELAKLKYPEYATPLDRARMEIWAGRYKLGLLTLNKAKDADAAQVALLRATALAQTGRRDQAIEVLSKDAVKDEPRVQILRAVILEETGKLDEAFALVQEHLKAHAESIAGHFQLGHLAELKGDYETARDAYKWFIDEPQRYLDRATNDSIQTDSAEDLTYIGRA